jgi:hypothetical protein
VVGYPEAEDWIRLYLKPVGPIELTHNRPWSKVFRVPIQGGHAWFKACQPVQAFEPRLSARLSGRWPDTVATVLAYDEDHSWLLLADAGTQLSSLGNPPETWLTVLPRYAELQRGEAPHAKDHTEHGVPALPVAALPRRYAHLVELSLPLEAAESERLRSFQGRFTQLCGELERYGLPATVQHDDLHMANVYLQEGRARLLDWGDSSISHPFFSLAVIFRFLEEYRQLQPGDPWFDKLRDAYLEPWGKGFLDQFQLALQIGMFAHPIAWIRQREFLPLPDRSKFDGRFAHLLRRALRSI